MVFLNQYMYLKVKKIDLLASTFGIQLLLRAEAIWMGFSGEQRIVQKYNVSIGRITVDCASHT